MSDQPNDAPDSAELLRKLHGTVCRCGKSKESGASFCLECYRSLPQNLRGAIWRRLGEGYEEAYAEADEWLAEHKPQPAAQPADLAKETMQTDELTGQAMPTPPKPAEPAKSTPESQTDATNDQQ